ncbi:MAG TPA: SOS response-associated peptidase family protein [Bacillota bacterium]|nr:SOS response-associated peptidase family protein [Bacillota bacterium]HOK69022.1 SOS response-associated peptidase family protein [Bacillota bacterium]HPP84622.1 SOS response-associated peptidase family protein [Bacillota bacterium]
MCGRYTANTEDEVIEIRKILAGLTLRLASADDGDIEAVRQSGILGKEVFPSQNAPVISKQGRFLLSKWGFEKWDDKGIIINARCETADKSRFFLPYAKNSRCLIPANSYFEWKKRPGISPEKYRIGNGRVLFMAGFLKPANAKSDLDRFVILTKPADEKISLIHDRMPVLVKTDLIEPWLDGSITIDELTQLSFDDLQYETAS